MAISYPLALPTVTRIRSIDFRTVNAVAYSRSPFTFSGQAHAYSGQMWQADVTLPPMPRSSAEVWISWLISLKGQLGTFYLGDPQAATPRGSARDSDTILVNGAKTSGNTIALDSAPNSAASYLKTGDYLQIGSNNTRQLFKVLGDVDTNSSGQATCDIWPDIRTSIADNAAVTVQNAQGRFRLSSNETAWSISELAMYGITFGAIDAL